MTEPTHSTYLYCLVAGPAAPDLAAAPPQGLPGAGRPRPLALGDDLWAIAADVPLPDYSPAAVEARLSDLGWLSERALGHEAMVEHFTGAPALVPLKLFTLFTSDERARADLAGRRADLDAVIARVAGHEEWGARIHYDPRAGAGLEAAASAAEPPGSGREFLQRKQRLRAAGRGAPAGTAERAVAAAAGLEARAAAVHHNPLPEGAARPPLFDASFLVSRSGREDFERAAEKTAGELAPLSCRLTLTGPWPPYAFVGLDGETP